MAEIVAAASECTSGRQHLWPEVGYTEVINTAQCAGLCEEGDLVCTGLLNVDMPFIRYRAGDRGSLDSINHCSLWSRITAVEVS
jgi:phenylacetate-CoA ligase